MNNYFTQRQSEELYNANLANADKQLAKEYRRCYNKTKRQLLDMYDEVIASTEDGTLLVSDLYKYNRFYDLLNNIQSNLLTLGDKEEQILEKRLTNMYKNNSKIIGNSIGFSPAVDENNVLNALKSIWCADGKNWTDRIWTNKTQLQEILKNGIVDSVARGASREELVADLMKNMNVGYYNANRLARTELSYVQNKSAMDKYAEAGITHYEVIVEDDACEECKKLLGKKFKVGQIVVPVHPNCRCGVVAVIE